MSPLLTSLRSKWLVQFPHQLFVWLLLLGLLGHASAARAQGTPLNGTYTINSAQATAGTNFTNFTDAVAALNTNGVSGPVTFTVAGGPYNEQVIINPFTGASATNRVTFNGGGRTILFGSSNATQRAVITLNGADYVTIDNLVINAAGTGPALPAYGWGVHLYNNADNNVISNCTVSTTTQSTSTVYAGIVSNASNTNPTTTGTAANQNVTITGNTVTGGVYSILVLGSGVSTALTPGAVITNNTLRDFSTYGVYTGYLSSPLINGNDISRPTAGTVLSSFYGIYLGPGVAGATVEKNRIYRPFPTTTNSFGLSTYGIYLGTSVGSATPFSTMPNDILNNLVYDLASNDVLYGIYSTNSDYARYYHNTVSINDQNNQNTTNTYGLYLNRGEGVDIRNNIVRVSRTGAGTHYALYFLATTATTVSNYNDLAGSGPNFRTGFFGSTAYLTLANWQTANGGVYDQNSTGADPNFIDLPGGNLRPTSGALNGTATPLARVTQDFTGAARGATPDMGAYEFTPPTDDVALQSIDSPAPPVSAGARTVTVTIRNNGAFPLNTVRLEYSLNGGTAVTQNFTLAGGLASGATRALTFTTPAGLVAGSNTLTVTASLPNGNADPNPANSALTVTIRTALAGIYTINKLLPASSTNFISFSDVATALNTAGISAPVRFNVSNGSYVEQFVLGVVPGASATDTIVVDGGSNKQILRFAGNSIQPATVLLNGTNYVTLQNLLIIAGGTVQGICVHLLGAASNNRVSNCIVQGLPSLNSTVSAGLAASGSFTSATAPGAANNLQITNNLFVGSYYGIVLMGASATSRSTGIRVTNNEIRDFYSYGLDVEFQNGAVLRGNNIHRTTIGPTFGVFYGVYAANDVATVVENNRIHHPATGSLTSTFAAYGIYFSASTGAPGSENDILNNVIHSFDGSGVNYGLYNSTSAYARYYHNTVLLDDQAYTGAAASYGFYQLGLATGIELRNNLLVLRRTGTGSRYGLYFPTTTSTITSDYNDVYLGTGSNFFTGRYGTADYASLADWRTANSSAYDQNSLQTAPVFAGPAANDYHPTVLLSGSPTTLTRVPRDFAGLLRANPPTMGAYEQVAPTNDVTLVSIDSPTSAPTTPTSPVTVTVRNGGSTTLSSVTLSYSLNSGALVTQNFTGLTLANNGTQQLTFTTLITPLRSANTLTVTGSLPNGVADSRPNDNVLTITLTPVLPPVNDDPCGAIAFGSTAVSSTNVQATTSAQTGVGTVLPTCAGAQLPKDVWFSFVPTGTASTLTFTGTAAGSVRLFTSPDCNAGPFTQLSCVAASGANIGLTTVPLTGLTAGTRYYLAVAGYGSNDVTGSFTISGTGLILGARAQAETTALVVYPNPSGTGQFALRLSSPAAGTATLLNALGQVVRTAALPANSAEHAFATQDLAAGVYVLRVQQGPNVLTRKVVLE